MTDAIVRSIVDYTNQKGADIAAGKLKIKKNEKKWKKEKINYSLIFFR